MMVSERAWKLSVVVWALLVMAGWLCVLPDTLALLQSRESVRFDYVPDPLADARLGACEAGVSSVPQGGALDRAGVRAGDVLVGHATGPWRLDCSLAAEFYAPNRTVAMEVRRGGQILPVQVTSEKYPFRPDYLFNNAMLYFSVPFVIAMGLLIALRNPAGPQRRWLVAFFLGTATTGFGATAYTALPPELIVIPASLSVPILGLAPLGFFLRYPGNAGRGPRHLMARWVWPLLCIVWVLFAIDMVVWSLGRHHLESSLGMSMSSAITNVCVAVAMWDGWRCSDAQERQRLKWMIAAFVAFVVFLPLGPSGWEIGGWQIYPVLNPLANLLAMVMLTYAIVRHRVLDFGFAVNRTAVYSVTTMCLLVGFGVLEWAAEHLLKFRSREENLVVDVAVALAIFMTFHRIRDWVEEGLDHLFFSAWRQREARLGLDFRRLALATQSTPLLDAMLAALDRFTGGAGAALYLDQGDGAFALAASTLAPVPEQLDVNAPLVLAVREAGRAVWTDEFDDASVTELALPIGAGARPLGLALLGPKHAHGSYRPDEVLALADVTRRAGESLQALHVSDLRRENQRLRAAAGSLRAPGSP